MSENRIDSEFVLIDVQDNECYGEHAQKLGMSYGWTICGIHSGMTLYVDTGDTKAEQFISCVYEGLNLIKYKDPRRFARIKNTTKHIVLRECKAVARYSIKLKICSISPSYLDDDPKHRIFTILSIATALIHEATHGRVSAAGIPYTKRWRNDIEKLCKLEERRFLKRIDPNIVKKFRPT